MVLWILQCFELLLDILLQWCHVWHRFWLVVKVFYSLCPWSGYFLARVEFINQWFDATRCWTPIILCGKPNTFALKLYKREGENGLMKDILYRDLSSALKVQSIKNRLPWILKSSVRIVRLLLVYLSWLSRRCWKIIA